MKRQQLISQMKEMLKTRTTEELKEMARELMKRFDDGAGVVFNFVLDELEVRISEVEYTAFCETL